MVNNGNTTDPPGHAVIHNVQIMLYLSSPIFLI